jgi:dienelactone hydrolase
MPRLNPDLFEELNPPFEYEGRSLRVFKIGVGPPVIILHEITGLSPETFRLGRMVAQAGFAVYLPLLFGKPGDSRFLANGLRACAGAWFHCLDRDQTNDPQLVETLVALSRRASEENGSWSVGIIGMCMTANTGLELVREDSPVQAIVASQPALPFLKPYALGVSGDTLRRVRDAKVPVLALRFTGDPKSPRERLLRLQNEIGDRFTAYEIDSGPLNSFGIRRQAHAVLTVELVDEPGHPTRRAFDKVIQLFKDELHKRS